MHSCRGAPWSFGNVPGALEPCASLHRLEARASRPRAAMRPITGARASCPRLPHEGISRGGFLEETSSFLHSRAPLPLIPPIPFSHKGRRGSLGGLMPHAGVSPACCAPPGCAGVSPACRDVAHYGSAGIVPSAAPRGSLKGRVPGKRCAVFCIPVRLCPSSPRPPSPTRGEGGVWAA